MTRAPRQPAHRRRESEVLRAVLDELRGAGIRAWRQNTGAARTPDGRVVRFGSPGLPDVTGWMPCGCRLDIECKRPGGKLRPEQAAYLEEALRAGVAAGVATCREDVRKIIDRHVYMHECETCQAFIGEENR